MDNFSPKTVEALNELLAVFFDCNAKADNMSYSLAIDLKCELASEFFHKNYAHVFPSDIFADRLSDVMVQSNIRPVRKAIADNDSNYENIVVLFKDNLDMMVGLKNKILTTIEILDYDNGMTNKELIIELENILVDCAKWLKVAKVWADKAEMYFNDNDVKKFDLDFSKLVMLPKM